MDLKSIMSTDVQYVAPDDSIVQAARIMEEYNIGSIPVCTNKKIVGVVTDRDIVVRNVAKGQSPVEATVSNVMSTDIQTATPDMDVHQAAEIMSERQIRRLPVVDNGNLVGIVAIGDLAVRGSFENEAGDALSKISKNSY